MRRLLQMKKLKIGLVFDDSLDSNDGVQQYVKTLGKWLIGQGHQVRFLVGETKNAGELQKYVYSLSRNIKIKGNQNKMFLPLYSKARDIDEALEKEQFDILHIMMPFNPLMGSRVIKRSGNIPKIASFHMVGGTHLINYGASVLSFFQRNTLQKIDTYLSVSSAAQAFEKKHFKIDSQVSPNMVELSAFKAGKRKNFLRGENGTIVFLGRLVERKGVHHLLKALVILKNEGSLDGVLVHICGDGELRDDLEHFTNQHKLKEHVIFHGFIDAAEKADYLASADIAVFPATGGEAFGIVLIEAMATGKPVVIGGNNDGYTTVLGEKPDQLIDPLDAAVFAETLKKYLVSPELRKQAVAWQNSEVEQYDVETVGRDVVSLYYGTIGNTQVVD